MTGRILIHMGDPYLIENPCTKRMRAFKDALKKQGFEVVIMAPDIKGIAKNPEITYCRAIPLKKKNIFYRLANGGSFAFSSVFALRKIGKIDIVITTTPPALISMSGWMIAKIKHSKLIYDVRDLWPDVAIEMNEFTKGSIYYKIFKFIRDFMLNHADLITAVSDGKVNKLKEYVPHKDVIKIPNGFEQNFLDNQINTALYETVARRNDFICVYTGNLGLAQGLKQLLYIAEKARDNELAASFWLYGSGAEEQELKAYVEEHKLDNVFFGGRLKHQDIYTVLKASDLSFIPLVNENLKDSIPTKIYEALGVGCPVLLAAEGDAVSVLKEAKLGIAVKPNQREALWDAFWMMYSDKEQMEQWKNHAIELMKGKYSIQNSAQAFVKRIEEMCLK